MISMNLKRISLYGLLSLLFACHHDTDETAAIKKLLETESASWRSGDVATHAACWSVQPYSRILVSTFEGKTFDVDPKLMLGAAAGMGQGGSSSNSNYKMNISGHTAWVSHDEISVDTAGHKSYSYEVRLLEKIKGDWKITGQSIHVYKKE